MCASVHVLCLDRPPVAPLGDYGSRSDKQASQTWQEASNVATVDLEIPQPQQLSL